MPPAASTTTPASTSSTPPDLELGQVQPLSPHSTSEALRFTFQEQRKANREAKKLVKREKLDDIFTRLVEEICGDCEFISKEKAAIIAGLRQEYLHERLSEDEMVGAEVSGSEVNGIEANGPGRLDGADDADLFGSDSENEGKKSQDRSSKRRKLDEADLDSGDDVDRRDRAEDEYDEPRTRVQREENILDIPIGRHSIPKPSDGELHLLQFPNFLGIEEKLFTPNHWKPPATEHHTTEAPPSTFSAYTTSNNTIRWRRSPTKPDEIQSNARVLRWSDGSLTIQLASNPREQFALSAKPLAPPQVNPPKPTPTSISKPRTANSNLPYNAQLDSHTYLASPHAAVSVVRLTNHITTSLVVQSHADQDDEALIKLQETMAAAAKGKQKTADGGIEIIHITEDPEKAKIAAEKFEKERVKATRRRQVQEERERDRSNRVLGRSGLRQGGYSTGLTVGGLEDDDGMTMTRARSGKPKKKPRRRNSEYSDEEEFSRRGRTREDEYDEEDDFLVGSDEEPEVAGDASEEEEELEEEEEEKPSKSASRNEPAPTDYAAAGGGRAKRRRVIDEDDDE